MMQTTFPKAALKRSVQCWFLVTFSGQVIFAYYIAAYFAAPFLQGNFVTWEKVAGGIISGDIIGNLAVAGHLFPAIVISIGGPLQLIPQIRQHFPAFHRWNGRIYIVTVLVIGLGGLYMVWGRWSSAGGPIGMIAASLNGILMLLFASLAWRTAIGRRTAIHQRWALRLFIVSSGVWYFRVGLMGWVFIHDGPFWFDMETFRGPFLTFWNFGCYLLPLAVLEIYLKIQNQPRPLNRLAMAGFLFLLTIPTAIGIYAATKNMWLARLQNL